MHIFKTNMFKIWHIGFIFAFVTVLVAEKNETDIDITKVLVKPIVFCLDAYVYYKRYNDGSKECNAANKLVKKIYEDNFDEHFTGYDNGNLAGYFDYRNFTDYDYGNFADYDDGNFNSYFERGNFNHYHYRNFTDYDYGNLTYYPASYNFTDYGYGNFTYYPSSYNFTDYGYGNFTYYPASYNFTDYGYRNFTHYPYLYNFTDYSDFNITNYDFNFTNYDYRYDENYTDYFNFEAEHADLAKIINITTAIMLSNLGEKSRDVINEAVKEVNQRFSTRKRRDVIMMTLLEYFYNFDVMELRYDDNVLECYKRMKNTEGGKLLAKCDNALYTLKYYDFVAWED